MKMFRERCLYYAYFLVSTAFGIGDESVLIVHDGRILFWCLTIIMSIIYVLLMCHLSGYVSAYFSIITGNRVQTSSWLKVCEN